MVNTAYGRQVVRSTVGGGRCSTYKKESCLISCLMAGHPVAVESPMYVALSSPIGIPKLRSRE